MPSVHSQMGWRNEFVGLPHGARFQLHELPCFHLAASSQHGSTAASAGTMRLTRTMMLEVLRQDYIRTAWSKGLKERVVIMRHAIKNALIARTHAEAPVR